MPQPTQNQVHINAPLTNLSIRYQQEAAFIAERVFPGVNVRKQSDVYFTFDRGDWFRTEAKLRPPATESAGDGYELGDDTYFCHVYALHKDVDDQVRANADTPLAPDREATEFVTNGLLLKRDLDWASSYFGAGIWTTDLDGVAATPTAGQFLQWNDAASDPIIDVATYQDIVLQATGKKPNVLVISQPVFTQLKNNPSIIERIKYTQRGVVTLELLASLLEVDEVIVAGAINNIAEEGAADDMQFIIGKGALLVYRAPSAGLNTVSGGYTFKWTGYSGRGGTAVSRFRMDKLKADRVEGEMTYDMKVIAPDVGVFFATAIA